MSTQILFTISAVAPRIFLFTNDMQYDRSMIFLRAQEFYESSNLKFQGQKFSFFHYMDWYAKNLSKHKSFTYGSDWTGFNIPSAIIDQCYAVNDERTPYDNILLTLVQKLYQVTNNDPFYLIAADRNATSVMDHEIAHGLFFTEPTYRSQMTDLVNALPNKESLFEIIANMGYAKSVLIDEAQAYLSTGLKDSMQQFSPFSVPFKQLFETFPVSPQIMFEKSVAL